MEMNSLLSQEPSCYLRDMTLEESEEYLKQQKHLHDFAMPTRRALPEMIGSIGDEQKFIENLDLSKKHLFPAKTLGMIGDDQQHQMINPPFVIKKDVLAGYILEKNIRIINLRQKISPPPRMFTADITLPITVFRLKKKIENVTKNTDTGSLNEFFEIWMLCGDTGNVAISNLFEIAEKYSYIPHYPGQNLYKLSDGPGDKCLVCVGIKEKLPYTPWDDANIGYLFLSDGCIYFVRGNIAVMLRSSYNNFGCMDLAKKLDAFLLEEAKRQAEGNTKVLKNHEF
jgi:hypothetical protein